MKKEIKVTQNEEAPIAVEVIADSIKGISEGIKKLRSTKLNDKGLFILIHHACGSTYANPRPSVKTIMTVLEGIESLERTYLKKV